MFSLLTINDQTEGLNNNGGAPSLKEKRIQVTYRHAVGHLINYDMKGAVPNGATHGSIFDDTRPRALNPTEGSSTKAATIHVEVPRGYIATIEMVYVPPAPALPHMPSPWIRTCTTAP